MLDKINSLSELAAYVSMPLRKLLSIEPEGLYKTFFIDKPGSNEQRLIEYPTGELDQVLKRLCDGLQWLYLDHMTDAAYGYIRKIKPCRDPRDIYTNALRHLGRKYLLNIDLDDFFHQVNEQKIRNLLADYTLFSFNPQAEKLMLKLVLYRGRLPMGSPTSPPLSNFATIQLDNELLSWARRHSFVYTRFVDDLSFSSNMQISQTHFEQIIEILTSHSFKPDYGKIKWFGPADCKVVTGLVLEKSITVPQEFLKQFDEDLHKLRGFYTTAHQYPDANVFEWLEKMKQVIHGRLAFLKMIYGPNHQLYIRYRDETDKLFEFNTTETTISWRYAGYEYC